jgi:hypothetical protein
MHRFAVPATAAAALLLGGTLWAFDARSAEIHAGVTSVLAVGTLVGLGAIIAWVVHERGANGLVVPESVRLPFPAWWAPLIGIALLDLVGGLFASIPMAIAGVVLLATALIGAGGRLGRDAPEPDRASVVAARRIRGFAQRQAAGDPGVRAALEHVGRGIARIVLVGGDGRLGDLVLRSGSQAEQALALAGAQPEDPTAREFTSAVRTGPYEWRRMAGLQLGGR